MGIVQEKLPSRQQFNGLHRQLLDLTLMEGIIEKECFYFFIEKMGGGLGRGNHCCRWGLWGNRNHIV